MGGTGDVHEPPVTFFSVLLEGVDPDKTPSSPAREGQSLFQRPHDSTLRPFAPPPPDWPSATRLSPLR